MLDVANPPSETLNSEALRAAAIDLLRPLTERIDKERVLPTEVAERLASLGLPGADGFAAGAIDAAAFCEAAEALAWGDPTAAYAWLTSRQVAWVIANTGSAEQKARWLPRFAENPLLPASLYLYEGQGAAPGESDTTICDTADGVVVNGYKSPVFNPVNAEVSVIVGRDEAGALRAVLVEGRADGITFSGLQDDRLALGACPSAIEAKIEGLTAPRSQLLENGDLSRALSVCRLGHASVCIGLAGAATQFAGEWAQRRVAFGKPIIAYQGVSFVLVDLVMAADAVRLGIGELTRGELASEELERETSHIVAEANQVIQDASREGVQTLGVHGVMAGHPVQSWYCAAAVLGSVDFDPLKNRLSLV